MDGASFFKELVTMWVLTVGVTGPAQAVFVSMWHLHCVVCLVCLYLAGLCVSLVSFNIFQLARLAATSLAAPHHPLHPPSPEPGITVAFTRELFFSICFSPGLFRSVPVYLAATCHTRENSPMAPTPGRLSLSHLLPAKKFEDKKQERLRPVFCMLLQCSLMF